MSRSPQVVSGRWTQYGVQALEGVNVDVASLCRDAGFSYRALIDPTAWINRGQLAQLWSNAVRATGDPSLGLRAAERFQPAARDVLSHLLMSCESLGEGIQRSTRFFEISGDSIGLRLVRREHESVVSVPNETGAPSAWTEFRLAAYWRFLEMAAQRELRPLEARFRHPYRGAGRELYERVYRCCVSFDEPESCVVVPEEALTLPLPNACSEAASALEKAASDALLDPSASTIESQVRSIVHTRLLDGDYSESAVAEALHMSVRTLKRRLAGSDWSFTSLVDDIRRRIVIGLLLSSAETLEEIAPQAGYASPGSLVRAVKRWTGYTPAGLRAARDGGLADWPTGRLAD